MSARVIKLPQRRQWAAAKFSAQNADWNVYSRPIDIDIRFGLASLRARARELVQNADHARGFVRIVRNNIVGSPGYVLQSRATTARGRPDTATRDALESEWLAWGRRGNCEISGKFSWRSIQRHVIETVARDGEAFIRIVPAVNRWGMALQVIDPEAIDVGFQGDYQGREIRLGVEIDSFRRPVAYWTRKEQRMTSSSYSVGDRYRIPSEEMIHVYLPEFCWQTRGVPWLATGAARLHMLSSTEDTEMVASRASAAKFVAYEAQEWAPPPPDTGSIVDASGNPIASDPGSFSQDIAPGSMEVVPYGYMLRNFDPQHPNANMPDFLKWGLRSFSTGTGVSYNTIGNDAEGVNYTSLRFFLGVERDNWMEAQDWFESDFPDRVREIWTDNQILLGTVPYRPGRADQLHNVKWQPRRWEGADPAKQASADKQELENLTTTRTEIAARKGRDFDDLIRERARETAKIKAIAEQEGLTLEDLMLAMDSAASATAEPDADDEEAMTNA